MTGQVRSIDCPNCGAGLDVLGGGRVTTKICSYCGASLDATDAFRVIEVFGNMDRPESPFRLGITGSLDGAHFTVIGTLGQREAADDGVWFWVDHQIYSPTHGYAWLTVEDGHVLLTRKVRDWPEGTFLTADMVERAESRPSRTWRGRTYRYYAWSRSEVHFVEGEFNFRPRKGDMAHSVSLMPRGAGGDMLQFVEPFEGREREVEVTTYRPDAAAAFGAPPPTPEGVHPLQPYLAPRTRAFRTGFFAAMTAVAVALALLAWAAQPPAQQVYAGPPAGFPEVGTFEVERIDRPVRVELHQDLSNDFADYDLTLTDPAGEVLAETYRGISYYSGGSGADRWSEGSRYARLGFAPTVPGIYSLSLLGDASQGGAASDPNARLRVTVQTGQTNPIWLWCAAGLFALAFLWQASGGWRHRWARWRGSDWTEDD
ncbi:DUF4178 domain-containing protein [Jannaschia sp. S6380]|uniref:DUF4178 domain-containing protein n=1 Tax=Jannaschia sp. S6380 TaxID=2926408 RepID=UPI001FF18E82|nr:DUF4178 domain-containing protein [Jannaschia sp. S6380]MCK0165979.1 DUF4178 domain-containing protein [Jannaschia sp. S6380]